MPELTDQATIQRKGLIKINLTADSYNDNLPDRLAAQATDLLMKIMRRFEPRRSIGAGYAPLGTWLFLCPKSLLSPLKNPPLWQARLLEQSLCTAVQTNMNAYRPKLEPFGGGLFLSKGDLPMNNHAQVPKLSVNDLRASAESLAITPEKSEELESLIDVRTLLEDATTALTHIIGFHHETLAVQGGKIIIQEVKTSLEALKKANFLAHSRTEEILATGEAS